MQLLNIGNAVVWIEYGDPGVLHIGKAFQRGLAGIAGGGHKDADLAFLAAFFQTGGEKMGQNLQRHILEGTGGAVPQLKKRGLFIGKAQRSDGGVVIVVAIGGGDEAFDLLPAVFRQEFRDDMGSPPPIVHGAHTHYLV